MDYGIIKPGFYGLDTIKYDNRRRVRTWLIFNKYIYDYHIADVVPSFRYVRVNGDVIQPVGKNGSTDGCTTPPPLKWIKWLRPMRFKYAGTIHDSGYKHHRLIINGVITLVTQSYMDYLLEEMVEHSPDPGTHAEAAVYLTGVRSFGCFYWAW